MVFQFFSGALRTPCAPVITRKKPLKCIMVTHPVGPFSDNDFMSAFWALAGVWRLEYYQSSLLPSGHPISFARKMHADCKFCVAVVLQFSPSTFSKTLNSLAFVICSKAAPKCLRETSFEYMTRSELIEQISSSESRNSSIKFLINHVRMDRTFYDGNIGFRGAKTLLSICDRMFAVRDSMLITQLFTFEHEVGIKQSKHFQHPFLSNISRSVWAIMLGIVRLNVFLLTSPLLY